MSGQRPPVEGRIAIVAHTHPSLTKGGAEIAAHTLYTGLLELGADALFVAACPQADEPRLVLGSPRERAVFYAPERYESFYHLCPPSAATQLRQLLRRERVNIVNFHHFLNLGINAFRAVAADRSLHAFITLHEYLAICHHHGQMVTYPARRLCEAAEPAKCAGCFPAFSRRQFAIRRTLFLDALKLARGVISPSGFLADRIAQWGMPRDRIRVIDNGLPSAERLHRAPAPAAQAPVIFGYFGQITPFKGVDVLLDAAEVLARLPGFAERARIRIFGNFVGLTEDFVKRFHTLVDALPLLEYVGPYANEDVRQLMGECDYVVIPSTWWENSPLVVQEAFAAGCPIICTGIGGMREKVEHGRSGLHFRRGDGSDLAQTMVDAAAEGVLENLRRGLPPPRDAKTMAADYLDAFDRLLGDADRAA